MTMQPNMGVTADSAARFARIGSPLNARPFGERPLDS
jgi:hypothetical protein